MKRTPPLAGRLVAVSCAIVLAAAFVVPGANAQVQKAPPMWESHSAPVDCGIGPIPDVFTTDLYGFTDCQSALDTAQAREERIYASCGGRSFSIIRDCFPFALPADNFVCTPGAISASGIWHGTNNPINTQSGNGCLSTGASATCPDGSIAQAD